MLLHIDTTRLKIRPLSMEMARVIHPLSLDGDNRAFNPDEVFETEQDADDALAYLIGCYGSNDRPLVYAVLLEDVCIGHVELVPMADGAWEIGYHIGKEYTGHGYATEAVGAFLPVMMQRLALTQVYGVCVAENAASRRVMERCGFVKNYEGEGLYQGKKRRICRYLCRKDNLSS